MLFVIEINLNYVIFAIFNRHITENLLRIICIIQHFINFSIQLSVCVKKKNFIKSLAAKRQQKIKEIQCLCCFAINNQFLSSLLYTTETVDQGKKSKQKLITSEKCSPRLSVSFLVYSDMGVFVSSVQVDCMK